MKSSKILFLFWYPKNFGVWSTKDTFGQPLVNQLKHHRELQSIRLFMDCPCMEKATDNVSAEHKFIQLFR